MQTGLCPSTPISAKAGRAVGDHLLFLPLLWFLSQKTQVLEAKMLGWTVLLQKSWCGEKQFFLWPSTLHGSAKQGAKRAEESSGVGDAFQPFCSPSIHTFIPLQSHPTFLHLLFLSAACPSTLTQPQIPAWIKTPPWPLSGWLQHAPPTWQPVPELGHPPKDGTLQLEVISW